MCKNLKVPNNKNDKKKLSNVDFIFTFGRLCYNRKYFLL